MDPNQVNWNLRERGKKSYSPLGPGGSIASQLNALLSSSLKKKNKVPSPKVGGQREASILSGVLGSINSPTANQ